MGAGSRIDLNGAGDARHHFGSAASCDARALPLTERYAMTVPANSIRNPGTPAGECGPWNPGIGSRLPRELLPLSTMFRLENVLTGIEKAEELHDLTGLDIFDLVAIRPERLVLHELLIRVTADLSVPKIGRAHV